MGVNYVAYKRKPKTDFGIEVRIFTAQTGMTVKELQNLNNLRNDKLDIGDKLKVK